jgi:hypothetical protein
MNKKNLVWIALGIVALFYLRGLPLAAYGSLYTIHNDGLSTLTCYENWVGHSGTSFTIAPGSSNQASIPVGAEVTGKCYYASTYQTNYVNLESGVCPTTDSPRICETYNPHVNLDTANYATTTTRRISTTTSGGHTTTSQGQTTTTTNGGGNGGDGLNILLIGGAALIVALAFKMRK